MLGINFMDCPSSVVKNAFVTFSAYEQVMRAKVIASEVIADIVLR